MKKLLALTMLAVFVTAGVNAQEVVKKKEKEKKTTNIGQKIHNTFSKHKHYNGSKTKKVVKVEKEKH